MRHRGALPSPPLPKKQAVPRLAFWHLPQRALFVRFFCRKNRTVRPLRGSPAPYNGFAQFFFSGDCLKSPIKRSWPDVFSKKWKSFLQKHRFFFKREREAFQGAGGQMQMRGPQETSRYHETLPFARRVRGFLVRFLRAQFLTIGACLLTSFFFEIAPFFSNNCPPPNTPHDRYITSSRGKKK